MSTNKRTKPEPRRLNALGIEVIRYTNTEIMNNLEGVHEDLLKRVTERGNPTADTNPRKG